MIREVCSVPLKEDSIVEFVEPECHSPYWVMQPLPIVMNIIDGSHKFQTTVNVFGSHLVSTYDDIGDGVLVGAGKLTRETYNKLKAESESLSESTDKVRCKVLDLFKELSPDILHCRTLRLPSDGSVLSRPKDSCMIWFFQLKKR